MIIMLLESNFLQCWIDFYYSLQFLLSLIYIRLAVNLTQPQPINNAISFFRLALSLKVIGKFKEGRG